MPPAANDHSASDGNDENLLLKFNIPILPGDNYELTTYKSSIRKIATVLNNKTSYRKRFQIAIFQIAFTDKQTIVMPLN